MEFFRIKKDIPFMRHALVLNAISFITFLAAVFFLWLALFAVAYSTLTHVVKTWFYRRFGMD